MRQLLALFALLVAALAVPAEARAELDCWVPNREESADGKLPFRSPQLAPFRDALLAAEQVVRDNPHFKAMPRRIRMRSTLAVGGVVVPGEPRYGQLNVTAYRPDVWEGKCGLNYGADRCCSDGNVTILFNNPRTFLAQPGRDPRPVRRAVAPTSGCARRMPSTRRPLSSDLLRAVPGSVFAWTVRLLS